jgi:hypothetical protein
VGAVYILAPISCSRESVYCIKCLTLSSFSSIDVYRNMETELYQTPFDRLLLFMKHYFRFSDKNALRGGLVKDETWKKPPGLAGAFRQGRRPISHRFDSLCVLTDE